MTRSRIAAALLAVGLPLIIAAPSSAANKEQQQMLADIRMLQEQAQLLQNMLASLGVSLGDGVKEGVKAVSTRIEEQTAALRKTLADQKLVIDNLTSDLRVVREKVDDNNVRIGSLSQELDALRRAVQEAAVRPPTGDPLVPGTTEGGPTPPPSTPSIAPGTSPEKMWNMAWADYTVGQYDLAIQGFEAYIREFPKSNVADDAQVKIGVSYDYAGNKQKALEAFDKAIRNYPGGKAIPDAYYRKGLLLRDLKQPDQAREAWEYLLKTFPDSDAGRLAKQQLEQLK